MDGELNLSEVQRRVPQRLLGIRVSALLETLAFLAGALLLDWLLGEGRRFTGFSPHPFWIIVLLTSTHYGTNEGLFAALLAAVALLAGNLPEQGFAEDQSAWLLRVSREPVLWVVAAVVIGEIQSGHQRLRGEVTEERDQARREAAAISQAYEQLVKTNGELEVQVAAQNQTVQSVYRASRALERRHVGEVVTGAIGLVRAIMGSGQFSLFLLNEGALEMSASEAWSPGDPLRRAFETSSLLFQAVIRQKQVLVVTDPADETVLSGEGILAGPLISQETGEVVGMLKVEDLRFAKLNPSSIQNFRVLCEWIGAAVVNARRAETGERESHSESVRKIVHAAALDCQRTILDGLAQRLEFTASVLRLGVELPLGPSCSASRAVTSLAPMIDEGPSESRPTSVALGVAWDYVILLPGIGADGAETIGQHFVSMLADKLADAGLAGRPCYTVQTLKGSRPQAERAEALG